MSKSLSSGKSGGKDLTEVHSKEIQYLKKTKSTFSAFLIVIVLLLPEEYKIWPWDCSEL